MTSPELVRMSHSRYQQYASCGERYRLERIEKVPTTPSIYSVAGTVFHDWTDHEDTGAPYPGWASQLDDAVGYAVAESGVQLRHWDDPSKDPEKQYRRFRDEHGPAWQDMYRTWRRDTGWTIAQGLPPDEKGNSTGVEYRLTVPVGTVSDVAIVDRIFATQQGLRLVDTKTWSRRRTEAQLPWYAVAARSVGIDVADACYYEARKGTHTEPRAYHNWTMDEIRVLHEQAAYMIRDGYFLPRPNEDCSAFCGVRRNCRFAL